MALTGTRLTLAEFLMLPEEEPALEYEDGEVTQKASPRGQHSVLQFVVADAINSFTRSRRLAWAFPELRTTFAGVSRVPDVAVYRWDRIPRDSAGRVANDFTEPPDIAIEVVSPGQSVSRLLRRCLSFVNAGVLIAVLVDPPDESIVVVRPGQEPVVLRAGDTLDLDGIITGLRIEIAALFEALRT